MTDSISDNAHNYQLGYTKGLADGRKEEREKVLELLVDEEEELTPVKHGFEWNDVVTQGRNELRAELRQQIKEMK